uniref:Uncharacterized protein n=1 Tax=Romanomermis culicivorax TaxID=13658 RepID=A0A915IDJ9_ROMCU
MLLNNKICRFLPEISFNALLSFFILLSNKVDDIVEIIEHHHMMQKSQNIMKQGQFLQTSSVTSCIYLGITDEDKVIRAYSEQCCTDHFYS